jgi:transcriptional regulator with XRE-family HTH domain
VHGLRTAAGLSVAELARRSGVARATLMQLEGGAGNPTLETLYALADALGATMGDLIAAPAAGPTRVVRAGEGPYAGGEAVRGHLLDRVTLTGRHVVELFALELAPGRVRTADPHPAGVTEHLLLTRGRARVGPADAPVELEAGDFVAFDGAQPHVYAALGRGAATASLALVAPA